MSKTTASIYEIRIKGRLNGEYWAIHFDGMTIMPDEADETILRGVILDQAALYGILTKLRNLALPLLSVNVIEDDRPAS